ncbi:MAG: tyrosine--tRNA ligase [Candidatus Woesebacteria bacterium]|nr:MAG: tyrosine--tRNA ligase [Candidatus Woesebacteria bacterium]
MSERLLNEIKESEKEAVSVRETLTRSIAVDDEGKRMVMPDSRGLEELMGKKRVRLYLGIDPTSPELHIGHTVPLRKLRQFQELGHEVNLLFGGFTATIGDPSDRTATRIKLTRAQVESNMSDYVEQAGKILDLSPTAKNKITLRNNADWLSKLTFEDVTELAANFSVQQMMNRSTYKNRYATGTTIGLHEFLYPLMQGWDSVAMDVDLEVGGKDQVPNMLDGRTLVKNYKNHEKWVLGTRLIEDPNGKKMGKTEGNIVNIRDLPEVKYEGIMTWPDSAIAMGFELITSIPMEQVEIVKELLAKGELDPMKTKEALAFRVVQELDGIEAAKYAQEEFNRVKRQGLLPRRMREVSVAKGTNLSSILLSSGLVKNKEEALFKIAQKSVFIDNIQFGKDVVWPANAETIATGKKTIRNIRRVVIG